MEHRLEKRIRKIERQLAGAENVVAMELQKRAAEQEELLKHYLSQIRCHAISVAAIVLYGEPKIDEPLVRAWGRVLRYHGIAVSHDHRKNRDWYADELLDDADEFFYLQLEYEKEIEFAHKVLNPIIFGTSGERQRFSEIFRNASVWLLEFTMMRMDAAFLHFDLPVMKAKQSWGDRGFKNSMRHPQLPIRVMTAGDPLPEIEVPAHTAPEYRESYRMMCRRSAYLKSLRPEPLKI